MMPFKSGFRITSPYGNRVDPFTGIGTIWHGGVDLVGNDTKVSAVVGGVVLQSRMITDKTNLTWEWGNYVSILADDGKVYYYCHLASRMVKQGDTVAAGQHIGIEGATGRVTGVHLHFEVRNSAGKQIDPCAVLGIPNQAGFAWDPVSPWVEQASPWAKDAADWAVKNGIVAGKGGDNYGWQDGVTREELAVMLKRYDESKK